ncbi:MAG: uracil-DNA glycosylase [Phycisphaerales bacterium]|nr:MAG: uracil-DNA glycosylase [Phycisphaerales bacterium]
MEIDSGPVRAAIRQQLMADRLLGIKSVPMKTPPRKRRKGGSAATKAEKAEKLRELDETWVKGCRECKLCETRTQTVFGQGDPAARIVFVGEAPGSEEDKQGLAFVGRAGQLLTRMIIAMGLSREDVFICNVLKCRPPQNRDPSADEILSCNPYLSEQLAIIQPQVLVALGAPAAKTLLGTAQSIGKLRGHFHEYCVTGDDGGEVVIPVMPTYHPAYLLRNPAEKRKVWEDLQTVMKRLGLPAPQGKPA